jgi:hypothetical protein
MASPVDPATDRVRIVDYAPERITLDVSSTAPGLLVLSEVSYPGWKVSVDGEPAESYVVDHLLRGVALPAGAHTVEWRYHSDATALGLAITLATIAGLGAIGAAPLFRRRALAGTRSRPAWSPLAPTA